MWIDTHGKLAVYKNGKWVSNVPYACRHWTDNDWINHITGCNGWPSAAPFPLKPLECCGLVMLHCGFDKEGVPLYTAAKNHPDHPDYVPSEESLKELL